MRVNLFGTVRGRRTLFTALYVSEGAPSGFLWWALPAHLRLAEVSVPEITALTSALVVPWTLKCLWAPLVDRWQVPRVGFRVWIIAAQLVMGLSLLPLLGSDPTQHLRSLMPLLIVHAVAAATQDVAVDGLAIALVEPQERGTLQAYTQAGMLAARAAFGGGALWLSQQVGFDAVVLALCAVTWSSLVLVAATWPTPEPQRVISKGLADFGAQLHAALATRTTGWAVLFALLSAAGFKAASALAGPMLVDYGLPRDELSAFLAGPPVVAMVVGGFVGGRISDRWTRTTAVGRALLFSVISVCAVALVDTLQLGTDLLLCALVASYLGAGCFLSSSYALYMDLSKRELGATQFSLYMAALNGCEAWASWSAGQLQPVLGYGGASALVALASLFSLLVLHALAKTSRAN